MRIKYGSGVEPLFNGNSGNTFMRNPVGQSQKTNGKNRHFRSAVQLEKMAMFTAIARIWQTLSASEKLAWSDFVTAIPQPSNRDPLVPLKAFQNYQKRNFYKSLAEGNDFSLLSYPNTTIYEIDLPTFAASIIDNRLILSHTFVRSAEDLTVSIFIFSSKFSTINSNRTQDRYIVSIPNLTGTSDITDQFIEQFGYIPENGDSLIFRCIECANLNGQFWFMPFQKCLIETRALMHFHSLYPVSGDPHNRTGTFVSNPYSLAEWNTFFSCTFTNISVVGTSVDLWGASDLYLSDYLFYVDTSAHPAWSTKLRKFDDYRGIFTSADDDVFGYAVITQGINLPSLHTAGAYCFEFGADAELNLPSLINIGSNCFDVCLAVSILLNSLATCVFSGGFNNCVQIENLYLPSLASVDDNALIFNTSSSGVTITIPSHLMTDNGGFPIPAIQNCIDYSNVPVTIIQV